MSSGYLLGTNVLSELRKKRPDPTVLEFFSSKPATALRLSSLTLGELRRGIEKKKAHDLAGAATLKHWVDQMESEYGDRILPVDAQTAALWGTWTAGRSRPIVDTLLAATAAVHQLVLVTRNVSDVQDLPIQILNPWL